MNWRTYCGKCSSLYHERGALVEQIDKEIEALHEAVDRNYKLDEHHTVIVSFRSRLCASMNLVHVDETSLIDRFHEEVNRLSPAALIHLAMIKEEIDRYLLGEIDTLPPSDGALAKR